MPGDAFNARIKDYVEHFDYLWKTQVSWHNRIEKFWRRWYNDPTLVMRNKQGGWIQGSALDGRPPLKDWQHLLVVPHGFINEEATVTAMSNLMVEASPPFRARGWQLEDIPTETPLEALANLEFAILNPLAEWARATMTRGFVQGCAPIKIRYQNNPVAMNLTPRSWDLKRFEQRLALARDVIEQERAKGDAEAQDPPGIVKDPETGQARMHPLAINDSGMMQKFAQWAALMAERYNVEVPMPPVSRRQIVGGGHVGLKIDQIEKCDILWDVRIPTMREQKRVYQRLVVDKLEYATRCKKENERAKREGRVEPFDLQAIESLQPGIAAIGTSFGNVGLLQQALLQALEIDSGQQTDPAYAKAIEIIEVWEPSDALGNPYWCHIGQRDKALTREGHYPLPVPTHTYVCYENIPTPGFLVGISEYQIHQASHDHLDTMRGLIADGYALGVGQPIVRRGGLGIAGRDLEFRPFTILDDDEGVTYEMPYKPNEQLNYAVEYTQLLKGEIDQGMGTGSVQRGESADLARVGVGEVQLRAQNQANRTRARMHIFATMCSRDAIPLGMMQVYQFGDPDHVRNVAGGTPFEAEELMATDNIMAGMVANHLVMPAALIVESALDVQQLQEAIKLGGELGLLVPAKKAAVSVFGRLLTRQRVQGGEQILALMAQDLEEQKGEQSKDQQLQQAQQQLAEKDSKIKAVQAENDKLRARVAPIPLPPMLEMEAELEAIKAGAQPPVQAPPGPDEETPPEQMAEGGMEEPGEQPLAGMPPAGGPM